MPLISFGWNSDKMKFQRPLILLQVSLPAFTYGFFVLLLYWDILQHTTQNYFFTFKNISFRPIGSSLDRGNKQRLSKWRYVLLLGFCTLRNFDVSVKKAVYRVLSRLRYLAKICIDLAQSLLHKLLRPRKRNFLVWYQTALQEIF